MKGEQGIRDDGQEGCRLFAIGDIHGCHGKLEALLAMLPFDRQRDTLIFLGDYINRGPDSRKVLESLVEIAGKCRHTVFLKGNHDHALLQYAETGDVEILRLLRVMGVEETAASYGLSIRQLRDLSCLPAEHLNFMRHLAYGFIAGRYVFTHADISQAAIDETRRRNPGRSLITEFDPELLSSRRLGQEQQLFEGCTVVFGHVPFAVPLVRKDRIGIDTGAVYGGCLTAVELPALRFYHA